MISSQDLIIMKEQNEQTIQENNKVICEKEPKILACFPGNDVSSFEKLCIFISRLYVIEKLCDFLNIFHNLNKLRNLIYRDDGFCKGELFLENLSKKIIIV